MGNPVQDVIDMLTKAWDDFSGTPDATNANSAGTAQAYTALQQYGNAANANMSALQQNANLTAANPSNVFAQQFGAQNVNGLGQYAGFAGDAARGAQNAASYGQQVAAGFQPDAGLQSFMSYSPQMQQMALGQYSPLAQGLNAQAADQSRLAMQNAAGQFANQGALHSGAAMAAMGEAAARPFADVQNQLGMAQTQQNAALQQQLMGQTGQNAQVGAQLGLQGAQLGLDASGQQANTFQNLAGMDLSRLQGNQSNMFATNQANQLAALQAAQGNQQTQQATTLANQQAILEQMGLANALQGQTLAGYTSLGEQALTQGSSQLEMIMNALLPLLAMG